MSNKYSYTLGEDALGVVVELHGPGMPDNSYGIHTQQHLNEWAEKMFAEKPQTEHEAVRILHLLDAAFEAGKQARLEELLALLEPPKG